MKHCTSVNTTASLVSRNALLWLLKRAMGFQNEPLVIFSVRRRERWPGLQQLAFWSTLFPLLLQQRALLSPCSDPTCVWRCLWLNGVDRACSILKVYILDLSREDLASVWAVELMALQKEGSAQYRSEVKLKSLPQRTDAPFPARNFLNRFLTSFWFCLWQPNAS